MVIKSVGFKVFYFFWTKLNIYEPLRNLSMYLDLVLWPKFGTIFGPNWPNRHGCMQHFNFIICDPKSILKITCHRNHPELKLIQPTGLLEPIGCPNGPNCYPFFSNLIVS